MLLSRNPFVHFTERALTEKTLLQRGTKEVGFRGGQMAGRCHGYLSVREVGSEGVSWSLRPGAPGVD